MNQVEIGPVTIDDTISMEGQYYWCYYWDARLNSGHDLENKICIHADTVEREAHKRGKLLGMASYFSDEDSEEKVDLTYDEWSQMVDYREEFEGFVQVLIVERFKAQDEKIKAMEKELQELRSFKAANLILAKVIEFDSLKTSSVKRKQA